MWLFAVKASFRSTFLVVTAYTRDGTFQLNENGEIVTMQGYTISPGITVPADATSIDINDQGEVLVSCPVKHPQPMRDKLILQTLLTLPA